ncbi:MAG: response regulator transcription factor [Lachnospiraceae bacterium]|nr:response regulator transcription factor [Lachnospiraceae bacterium]
MVEFKIALCDDEEYFIDNLEKLINQYAKQYKVKIKVMKYIRVNELVRDISENNMKFDMLFLDVEMPECSGVEGAKIIRKYDEDIVIVFVTNYDFYALDAFEVEAIGYVVKPVTYEEIKKQIEKGKVFAEYMHNKEEANKKYLSIWYDREETIIEQDIIVFIEKRRNQCVVHLNNGSEKISYATLRDVYVKLNHQKFVFTHQGYIVNLDFIIEVNSKEVFLEKDYVIPLSRKYAKSVKKQHIDQLYQLKNNKK